MYEMRIAIKPTCATARSIIVMRSGYLYDGAYFCLKICPAMTPAKFDHPFSPKTTLLGACDHQYAFGVVSEDLTARGVFPDNQVATCGPPANAPAKQICVKAYLNLEFLDVIMTINPIMPMNSPKTIHKDRSRVLSDILTMRRRPKKPLKESVIWSRILVKGRLTPRMEEHSLSSRRCLYTPFPW